MPQRLCSHWMKRWHDQGRRFSWALHTVKLSTILWLSLKYYKATKGTKLKKEIPIHGRWGINPALVGFILSPPPWVSNITQEPASIIRQNSLWYFRRHFPPFLARKEGIWWQEHNYGHSQPNLDWLICTQPLWWEASEQCSGAVIIIISHSSGW